MARNGGIETAIGHWAQLMEGLQESPQHFYESLTAVIAKREIPDCRLGRVTWREGGTFSSKREYLRARRGDLLIDVCGAPFGNAFFASSWLCLPPPSIAQAVAMVVAGLFLAVYFWATLMPISVVHLISYPGPLPDQVRNQALQLLVILAVDFVFIVLVTIFGIIRPIFFPPRLTFYRYDTAQMFYEAVHQAVLEVIDGLRSAQGLRALTEDERKPIMRGLGR